MIEIRKMTQNDLDDVSILEKDIFSTPWSRDSFEKSMLDANNIYLVAREDDTNELAGYCGIWVVAGEGQINNVAVNPTMRNRHIATKMLKMAMMMSRMLGANDFTLEVRRSNESAIHLYEKIGLKNCGVRKNYYTNPKEDAIIMWLYGENK